MKQLQVLVVVALVLASVVPVRAQDRFILGLSTERITMGSPHTLGALDAQVRTSVDGSYDAARFDKNGDRVDLDDAAYRMFFSLDTVFGAGDGVEVGGRLRLSYIDEGDDQRFGTDVVGLLGRFTLSDGDDGVPLTLSVGLGKLLRGEGEILVEVSAVTGLYSGDGLDLDLDIGVGSSQSVGDPLEITGILAFGPVWRLSDVVSISLEAYGAYSTVPERELSSWTTAAASRLGLELGDGHQMALGVRRTIMGRGVREESAVLLTWRAHWVTEDGFLRLDYDEGAPPPEPEEE